MTCTRCHGLMLEEHLIDMEASYGEMWNLSWRCVNCGHRDDAVLQHHRQLYAKSMAIPQAVTDRELGELSLEPEKAAPLAA